MAFSLTHKEIKYFIQRVLYKRLGFKPSIAAIHIFRYNYNDAYSIKLDYVAFNIKDVSYVIDWRKKEIIIKGVKDWQAIEFDGRY